LMMGSKGSHRVGNAGCISAGVGDVRDESHGEANRCEGECMAEARSTIYDHFPQLGRLRDEVLFGDVWEQPELSKRDRSLITVATLTALYRTDELRGHIRRALQNGVTKDEIRGLITHLAFYAGWPTAVNAARVALEVFEER
jgi:4-carboxymuconolactone decarboxylase